MANVEELVQGVRSVRWSDLKDEEGDLKDVDVEMGDEEDDSIDIHSNEAATGPVQHKPRRTSV